MKKRGTKKHRTTHDATGHPPKKIKSSETETSTGSVRYDISSAKEGTATRTLLRLLHPKSLHSGRLVDGELVDEDNSPLLESDLVGWKTDSRETLATSVGLFGIAGTLDVYSIYNTLVQWSPSPPRTRPALLPEDDPLSLFWKSLPKSAIKNSVLRYEGKCMLDAHDRSSIFVRKCYESLWKVIVSSKTYRIFLIIGTPGIGKTIAEIYFLWQLAAMNKHVVFCEKGNKFLLFSKEGVCELTVDQVRHYGTRMGTDADDRWFIVDANDPSQIPSAGRSKMILVCSPKRQTWYDTAKNERAGVYYMPLWNVDELLQCNVALRLGIPEDVLRERVDKIGSIARYVLSSEEDVFDRGFKLCEEALKSLKIEWLDNASIGALDVKEKDTIDRIFHMNASDEGKFIGVTFASDFIAEQAIVKWEAEETKKMISFLRQATAPSAASVRGAIFERWVHKLLSSKSSLTFRCRRLGETNALPYLETFRFPHVVRTNDVLLCERSKVREGTYYWPIRKNQSALDAFAVGCGFQMTVSASHRINANGFREVYHRFSEEGNPFRLYFVVPEDRFDDWTKTQVFLNPFAKKEQSAHAAVELDRFIRTLNVEQVVLAVTLEESSLSPSPKNRD